MKEKITIEDLRVWGACGEGLAWFSERFPDGATLDELEQALMNLGVRGADWYVWLEWQLLADALEAKHEQKEQHESESRTTD